MAWLFETKHAATAAAHQTTAQANCTFHFRIMLEAAFAMASSVLITATKMFSSILRLMPMAMNKRNIEMPVAIQMEPIALPTVVSGLCLLTRDARTPVSVAAAIMVTGHAQLLVPHVDHAMATM